MPQAAQILDSFHVVAALHEGDRPCKVREEARLSDGRGDVRRVIVYRQGIGCCSPKPPLLVDDALYRG